MADDPKVCIYCVGPILLGDQFRLAVDGEFAHYSCWSRNNPDPGSAETVTAWGRDSATGLIPAYPDPVPETCEEAIRMWDAGEAVFTVEMGGLGPSYEQAIHLVAMELVRWLLDKELPPVEDKEDDGALTAAFSEQVLLAQKKTGVGSLSGGQAGSAINLACVTKRHGWRKAVRMAGEARMIQVMRFFPGGKPDADR